MPLAVEARNLTKTYGHGHAAVRALDGVSLLVRTGEIVAVMGPSGSGKTTLLALLGGLDVPEAGEVMIGGRRLSGMTEAELAAARRTDIGFVFQAFNLLPVLTAAENVGLPLLLSGQLGSEAQQRALAALNQVGLAHRATHRPGELSGGEQQRVAIARALVTNPRVVLADEPTGNLDSKNSQGIMRALVDAARQQGQTVMVITHDAGIAAWANRVLLLRDGRLVHDLALGDGEAGNPAPERVQLVLRQYEHVTAGVA